MIKYIKSSVDFFFFFVIHSDNPTNSTIMSGARLCRITNSPYYTISAQVCNIII